MRLQFTIRDLLWLLIVVALVIAWRIDRSRVPQWENKYETVTFNAEASDLDKLGTEGWEPWAYDFRGDNRGVWLRRQKR